VLPQLRRPAPQIVGRFLRNGEAGAFHAALRGILEPGAPAGADLEHAVARLEAKLLKAVVELAARRLGQALVPGVEDALRVGRMLRIGKGEEEVRVDVVVVGDRAAVRPYLAEQQRLKEAPRRD